MREVSCRILEMFFRELDKKGAPTSLLLDGVGYPLAHFKDKHERIEWSAFVRLMENAQKIWTNDEIVAMGGAWIDSPFLRHIRLIAGTLFTPKQFYKWLASDKKSGRGGGDQMFTCTTTTYRDLGPNLLSVEIRLDEHCAPCPAFFLLTKGGFEDIPRLVGKPKATVTMSPLERGARFEVSLPPGSDRVNPLHRAVRWLTAPAAAARELDDAHETLRARYEELEGARAKLAVQAAQLKTAHTVNELIQTNLDLDLTLRAVANALVAEAGFARTRVELDTEVDGVKIARAVEHGEGGTSPLERTLEGRGGHPSGKLTVFAHASANVAEREELLSFIVPSIEMALDNAISYLVVEEYRRSLEVRVEERTAELSQARDALAGTVRDLEQAKEVRDRIFANINHDLRSPLSLVLLGIDEARAQASTNGQRTADKRTLDAIEHGARRVLRMVDELLILAEGRETEVRLAMAPCSLSEMVESVAEAWKPAARVAGLSLEHDVEAGLLVHADPNALERVLANLVSNAVKFTPASPGSGAIEVRLASRDGRARIEVRDDGPGVGPELKPRLFGRFERGQPSRGTAISGSGLGLSLVKELAEAHGGSVGVEDRDGGGSVFWVELPLMAAGARPTTLAPATARLRPTDYGVASTEPERPTVYEPPGTARATILLAEDDPDLRDRTAKVLAADYRVLAAPDGLAALELAMVHAPDLLVTDIAMPGIDGIELTRRFRALPRTRMAPVLVLTTFGGVDDKLAGFDAGAIDYVHKPFEPAELRARVRSQLALRALALQLLETEKLAALGTLSAGLAHEIRNPANGIINAVGPLRALLPPAAIAPDTPAAQLLDVVEHCSRQVASLSRELLGFKRGVEPKRKPVEIETLLRRVKSTIRHVLEGIVVRERLDYRGTLYCAEPLLAQVLTNLLENGAHAAGRGGWVEIHTGLEDDRVVIELTDSGPGVPEELRERIFEPFFTTKPAGKGTGLGLSTARDIILRHGGNLELRRAADRAVFHLEMPLAPSHAESAWPSNQGSR
ncbi:MAG: response regulator [Labilithrix sp.]|nr:response regulator [Labilithrix sp.]